jgi:4-aminobutyrate aminotransferase-like enzyme
VFICSADAVLAGHSISGFFGESVLVGHTTRQSIRNRSLTLQLLIVTSLILRDAIVQGCAGQVFLPPSFVQGIYAIVRSAGGLCVADEVQTGFGRLGCWWAFETLGIVPDLVTLGKSIGNGYPMAALACTEEVAQAFDNGMEYFNSCAGTNTAAAVGLAVLDCIEQQVSVTTTTQIPLME